MSRIRLESSVVEGLEGGKEKREGIIYALVGAFVLRSALSCQFCDGILICLGCLSSFPGVFNRRLAKWLTSLVPWGLDATTIL